MATLHFAIYDSAAIQPTWDRTTGWSGTPVVSGDTIAPLTIGDFEWPSMVEGVESNSAYRTAYVWDNGTTSSNLVWSGIWHTPSFENWSESVILSTPVGWSLNATNYTTLQVIDETIHGYRRQTHFSGSVNPRVAFWDAQGVLSGDVMVASLMTQAWSHSDREYTGLGLHIADAGNGYHFGIISSAAEGSNVGRIWKTEAWSGLLLAAAAGAPLSGPNWRIFKRVGGDLIAEVWSEDMKTLLWSLTATDSTFSSGKVGLWRRSNPTGTNIQRFAAAEGTGVMAMYDPVPPRDITSSGGETSLTFSWI